MSASKRVFVSTLVVAVCVPAAVAAQRSDTSLFVTSVGKGKGADLGGLEGADAHCAALARAAGSTRTGWRAYLSTTGTNNAAGVNARDRIGKGPWKNAKGVVVARSVEDLHAGGELTKQTALTEKGEVVSGRGDPVNVHDMLTGSDSAGRYSTARCDTTCGNWTSSGDGSAIVGHSDRVGINDSSQMKSWSSSHGTVGCSQEALTKTGGAGLFYCFATD
jgi:hypothetical protein